MGQEIFLKFFKKFLVDGLHFSMPFRMWCTIEFGNKNRRTFLWWSNSGKR
jgi:hypothetical protein